MTPLALLLAQLLVILAATRLAGRAARALGQPHVVGEMAAGILLGPTLLGALAPGVSGRLFPAESLGMLAQLGQLGLLFFMFVVGLSIDPATLAGRGRTAVAVSHASIVVPFALGVAIAPSLHPTLAPAGVPFLPFALFVGAAMSVTAFPVLARILEERGLMRTRLGALAIACAAVDDVTAWCLLAVVVVAARAMGVQQGGPPVLVTALGALAFVAAMFLVVRPALRRLAGRRRLGNAGRETLAAATLLALAAALVTEALGVHALFGAFVAGAVMPRDERVVNALRRRMEDMVLVAFVPVFFAYSGLRTRVDGLRDEGAWLTALLILALAVLGKFGASAVAARLTGVRWREALALGALMNTRGLMELVILNVGLDIGVISPDLFSMMVLMALVTTAMTSPVLAALRADGRLEDGTEVAAPSVAALRTDRGER